MLFVRVGGGQVDHHLQDPHQEQRHEVGSLCLLSLYDENPRYSLKELLKNISKLHCRFC